MKAAEKSAKEHLSSDEISNAGKAGAASHASNVAAKKSAGLKEVHDATYDLNYALATNKNQPDHPDVLAAASAHEAIMAKHSGSKYFSKSEILAEVATARSLAKANVKAQAEFTKTYGNPKKVADMYDKEASTFAYLDGNKAFASHGNTQIAKLTQTEKETIESYTGPAFRDPVS